MSTNWVDYKELRQKLRFADVLKHYGVELKVRGDRASGLCPLPGHQGERRPSFSAHLVKGIFHCFGCGASGNLLDFAVRMEGLNPDDPPSLRQVALKLQERFVAAGSSEAPSKRAAQKNEATAVSTAETQGAATESRQELPVLVNAPLDFELKHLDAHHPYLKGRGLSAQTIDHFGLGFCSRGLLKDRIAIPLHDAGGALVGYCGRLVDDNAIDDEHPKYLLPPPRERAGKRYEFQKSLFLYRGFESPAGVSDLVVCEGFPSIWWLREAGFMHVVALMGSSCSPEQASLIVKLVSEKGRVWLLPDGDAAGERCAASVLSQVTPHRFVRWVKLTEGKQPTDCRVGELDALLPIKPYV